MLRLPQLTGVLLLVAAPFAMAESPMPDPIAPAVIGRPLDQIRPVRPVLPKPAAAKPNRPKPVAASKKAAPAAPRKALAVAPAAPVAAAAAPAPAAPSTGRVAKQALDDRVDPRTAVADNVGKGTRLARKRLQPGAYLGLKHQALVRQYYQKHPVAAKPAKWQIGEPVPAEAAVTGVPDEVRARLPLPPGHQYVQVDGEVVLIALASRMVVDGVSRAVR